MSSRPLVTIITPTYNRADYLPEVIDSVLSQGYEPLEYIVLDDGSRDNTTEVLQRYTDRVIFASHRNMGETRTVNKGFSMARGEIICVVNSDDPLLPGAIPAAVQAFLEHPEALVVYSDWLEIGPDSEPIREHRLPQYDIRSMLREFNVAMGPGTFFRRQAFELVGLRDVRVRYTGDLQYWFRLAVHGPFVHIPRALATHRTHPGAASSTGKGAGMARELIRLVRKVYREPRLPEDLRRSRGEVMARAHWVARHYCAGNRLALLRHSAMRRFWVGRTRLQMGWREVPRAVGARVRAAMVRARAAVTRSSPPVILGAARLVRLLAWRGRDLLLRRSTKSRRFLVVSHVLPPSWSGQAVILGRLLSGLDPRHYCTATVRNNAPPSPADEQGLRLPARCHPLSSGPVSPIHRCRSWASRVLVRLRIWQRAVRIASALYVEKCSAVVVATGDLVDPPAAALGARLAGAAFYLHLFDDYSNQWIDPGAHRLARAFERRLMRRAAGVIAPNEFMEEEVRRRYGRDVCIVRNVCGGRLNGLPPSSRADRGHLPSVATLLYTGAVYHVNTATLRTVISALGRTESPRVKLHVYTAQPPQFLESQGVSGPHVVHHGHTPGHEIERIQREADLLLIPFDFESSAAQVIRTSAPGKLGDYLASGTPILAVVPPDSFVAWYLRRHDCGLVVDEDDADVVQRAIAQLLEDGDLRTRLTVNAAQRAAEDFDPAPARRRLLNLLGIDA